MKKPALFLDRDGVVNKDYGYVSQIKDFVFLEGVFEFLRHAQNKGYCLIVVTNQSGVGRGYYAKQDFQNIMRYMIDALLDQGIRIDGYYAAYCHESAVEESRRRGSFFRKPNPGMLLEAALKHSVDLSQSIMIGDKKSDMLAAKEAGVLKRIWLKETKDDQNDLAVCVTTLDEARRLIG